MQISKLIISCTFVLFILGLGGCAKKNHFKPCHFRSLKESRHIDFQATKDQVTVRAKELDGHDCDKIFGECGSKLTTGKNPLVPIQLSIENNSDVAWLLPESKIKLDLVPTKYIMNRLHTDSSGIAGACFGIGALAAVTGIGLIVAIPTACVGSLAIGALAIGGWCTGVALTAAAGLLIIATPFIIIVQTNDATIENDKIDTYVQKTSLGKSLLIRPDKTVDVLLFVDEESYKNRFEITLINDVENKKLPFTISLAQD